MLPPRSSPSPGSGRGTRSKPPSSELEKAGVHIYHPTKDEMAQWMSVREKVWQQVADEFKGKIDLDVANEIFKLNPR